jgi:hypothetical protein
VTDDEATEVPVECNCGRRGVLLIEGEDGYVRHPEGTANCPLPPRDITHEHKHLGRPRKVDPPKVVGWITGGAL